MTDLTPLSAPGSFQISSNLIHSYTYWIGSGLANRFILSGKLMTVDEAKTSGLVNEIADLEKVVSKAEFQMKSYLSFDQEILMNTKQKLRKPWLDNLEMNPAEDLSQAVKLWWRPEIRKKIKVFIDSLKK